MASAVPDIAEDLMKIQEVAYKSSRGSNVPCMWDVGADTMGPGGANGTYIRQCKKMALIDSDKQLCNIHSRKFYLNSARSKVSAAQLKDGKPLRHTAAKRGVFKPREALATVEYWKTAKSATCPVMDKTTAAQGVYTLEQAVCSVNQ